jgi:tetratricopeptide (TPR) repeat protein
MKSLIPVLMLLCLQMTARGQGYDPAKVGKKAAGAYSKALEIAGNGDFREALKWVDQAIVLDARFVDAFLSKAGLHGELKEYASAVATYEKAFSLDPQYTAEYQLPYAINLAGMGAFQKAMAALDTFLSLPGIDERSRKAGNYRLECMRFATTFDRERKFPGYVFTPRNLGDSVNSIDSEYFPALTIDGRTLLFTRRLGGRNEDFFMSHQTSDGWGLANTLNGEINSNLNEGAQTLSLDGQFLVFTGCNFPDGVGNCDLYFSIRNRNGWSLPKNMGEMVNTEAWESAPSLSPDKRELYFASSMPGGFGGSDIYVTRRGTNGQWSEPENLGAAVNTAGNESCPFIHADNQTLYFTSNGHRGYGGDDLFLSRRKPSGDWEAPVNLGYPINTIENEGSLVVSADGRQAFYASDRADSRGGLDLYSFELREDIRPIRTLWVEGQVIDAKTRSGLPSAIELVDLASGSRLSRIQTDEDGFYMMPLPLGSDYAFHVNRKGYLFFSGNFPFLTRTPDSTYRMDIPLQPVKKDAQITLQNIFFATGDFSLRPESTAELDIIVRWLQENPGVRIRINGHTDSIGKAADNLALSTRRARAVTEYLRSKGIEAQRLNFQGFGSTRPIAPNTDETGRSRNRRTEMEIIAD